MIHLKAADGLAAIAVAAPTLSFITDLNEYFQLGATVVGIVAGLYAILWHHTRYVELKRRLRRESIRNSSGKASQPDSDQPDKGA